MNLQVYFLKNVVLKFGALDLSPATDLSITISVQTITYSSFGRPFQVSREWRENAEKGKLLLSQYVVVVREEYY